MVSSPPLIRRNADRATNATNRQRLVHRVPLLLQVLTAGFDPVLISLIRRSMPNLVAYDLAGVQPMTVLLDSSSRCVPVRRISLEARPSSMKSIPHSLVRTQVSTERNGFSDAAAGLGTTSQSGTNPGVLNPVGSASSTAI